MEQKCELPNCVCRPRLLKWMKHSYPAYSLYIPSSWSLIPKSGEKRTEAKKSNLSQPTNVSLYCAWWGFFLSLPLLVLGLLCKQAVMLQGVSKHDKVLAHLDVSTKHWNREVDDDFITLSTGTLACQYIMQ